MSSTTTMIIPTKNRQEYLGRLYAFYGDRPLKVIICDSSESQSSYKSIGNIEYFYRKNWGFQDKLAFAFSHVTSDYVLLGADDDFIFPEAVSRCADFLDKNRDYSSAQGLYHAFNKNEQSLTFYPTYPLSLGYRVNNDKNYLRLQYLWSRYMHLYYSVHRTEVFREILDFSRSFEISRLGLNFFEVIIGSVSVIRGKHVVLPIPYAIRECSSDSSGSSHPKLWDIRTKSAEDFQTLLIGLANKVEDCENFTLAKSHVEKSFEPYFKTHYYQKGFLYRPFWHIRHALLRVQNHFRLVQIREAFYSDNSGKFNITNIRKLLIGQHLPT